MIVSIIVAYDQHFGIGYNQSIPWKLPTDLKRFKAITMGHHLVMGRITFESIGRPLPGRNTIVVSRNPDYNPMHDIQISNTLESAISKTEDSGENELFICGGRSIYEAALKFTDRIYLTKVHTISEANVFFPTYNELEWREVLSFDIPQDEKNEFVSSFHYLKRTRPEDFLNS